MAWVLGVVYLVVLLIADGGKSHVNSMGLTIIAMACFLMGWFTIATIKAIRVWLRQRGT